MKWFKWSIFTLVLIGITIFLPQNILIICLGIWIVSNILPLWSTRIVQRHFHTSIDIKKVYEKNENAISTFKIQHESWCPLFYGYVIVQLRHQLTREVITKKISLSMAFKDEVTIELPIPNEYCGAWDISLMKVVDAAWCPFTQAVYWINQSYQTVILPKKTNVVSHMLENEQSNQQSETYAMTLSAQQTNERLGLRPYRIGDTLKQIHWKLSAKYDELIVEEQLEEQTVKPFLLYIAPYENITEYEMILALLREFIENCKNLNIETMITVDEQTYHADHLQQAMIHILNGGVVQQPIEEYIMISASHDGYIIQSTHDSEPMYQFTTDLFQHQKAV